MNIFHTFDTFIIMDAYIGGVVSGFAQTIIGHPLDTIKTWMQNGSSKQMSFSNLYRGVSFPLLQAPLLCGVGFGVYNQVYQYSDNSVFAGAVSGLVGSAIICPTDYCKIQAQQAIKPIYRQCIRTFPVVALREIPSNALYYSVYHKCRANDISIMLAGSAAGVASWGLIYPLDTIKTRLQTNSTYTIARVTKMKGIWKGFTPCVIRAFVVNGVAFYVYETTLVMLSK